MKILSKTSKYYVNFRTGTVEQVTRLDNVKKMVRYEDDIFLARLNAKIATRNINRQLKKIKGNLSKKVK